MIVFTMKEIFFEITRIRCLFSFKFVFKYVVKQIYGIHVRDVSILYHRTRHVLSLSDLIITFEQSECHILLSRLITLSLSTLRNLINSAIKLTNLMWQHLLLGVIPNMSFILVLKTVSEYYQEIPQSQTADNPVAILKPIILSILSKSNLPTNYIRNHFKIRSSSVAYQELSEFTSAMQRGYIC